MNKEKIFLIVFFAVVAIVLASAVFVTAFVVLNKNQIQDNSQNTNPMGESSSRMTLSSFDKELAKEMMDKDNDGKCDACGMPVDMCMSSGQLQCNMDPNATIGLLGSAHIHADFKVYVNGAAMNFDSVDYYMKSSFIHVDPSENSEEASGLLHMHATGVPLWIFFKSISLELPENMKAYVNRKEIPDYKNYVFSDLDKILITDGNGNLEEQLNSVTDFAKNH